MRISVIGAGAIGGTIAALLDRGGHDVAVTARGEHAAIIRDRGLALSGGWGEHVAHLGVSDVIEHTPELAFVCTKAQDARAAITANRAALGGIPVVVVQNGLGGVGQAAELLPDSECLGALVLYAASFLKPGSVTVTTTGKTYLGVGTEPAGDAVLGATAILGAVMPATATPNFAGCQWTKLVVNQINALPAITGLSVQETISDRRLRRIIVAGMREAVRAGKAAGVRFGAIQGLNDGVLSVFERTPWHVGQLLVLLMKKRIGATPNPGSTLQSIRRGQRTEIDFLNGAVVDAARRAGVPAPVNAAIVDLVHEVEESGRFLNPDETWRRVSVT